ncbi:phosphate regulon sensor histidine kinase PhoR [Oxalobacter paraformigenes]|uniref:Phosphate regulon sensor protein PhoR n=1 Tax=Oxalobacter paraformigenes TaxID=556268 RepID=C3X476_9BURK|nr:phosphate regulon sensor histidine kinase PhoR [Oxalobacter paraformigenes]EEO28012.1 phosphate regulon sensor kinase PhoR [Oxalobacter paraformigenes]
MNPHVLFWIPAALRLALIWIGSAVLWYFFGPVVGLLAGLALTTAITVSQLYYLSALDIWLDSPRSDRLPDGWGAWHAVYSHLYRLSHDEEKSKKELTEWLTRFREAMNFLPDGVAILDNVLFLDWCNPVAEKHLGLDLERDRDMRITNLVRNPAFIDYIILGRYDQPLEMKLNDRYLVLQIIPFGNRRHILVTHDRTDTVRTEKIRRDFVANASHELRTPLTVINGFLEVAIAQPDLDRETRLSHLKMMKEQGERMQTLVEGMLTLTNLESNDYPLKREPFNAALLVRQVFEAGQALSAGRHVFALETDGPETLYGSMDEIRTAFTNLVTNAIRYTPDGGKITVTWTATEEGPRFSVKDTGIGIEAKHIPRLTQRFYQVDKSRSRLVNGTGLGLSIVRHILLRHDAKLDIESETGKGSEFSVRFTRRILVP